MLSESLRSAASILSSVWAGASRPRVVPPMSLVLGTFVLGVPGVAHAYRTYVDDPEVRYPARWHANIVRWEFAAPAPAALELAESGLTVEDVQRAIAEGTSIAATPPCAHAVPRAEYGGMTTVAPSPGDGRNTIAFITDWSALGRLPARGATTEVELEIDADGTARIVEADIYLNLEDHRFSLDGAEGTLDVRSVIGHEWLHLLGFSHVCGADAGAGAPSCSDDPRFIESAVYPDYLGIRARYASADDLEGVCALYPASSAPCEPACSSDARCVAGACQPRPPSFCASDLECDLDGTRALRCASHGESTDTCVTSGSLWTSCESSAECGSGLCLTSMSAMSRFCTSGCTTDAECPPELVCGIASGSSVCRPAPPPSCAASPAQRRLSSWPWLVLMTVAFAARRPRRLSGRQARGIVRSLEERS